MMKSRFTRWLTGAFATLAMLVSTPFAFATDTIVLKDGTTLTGEIVREVNGAVWLKTSIGGMETTQFYAPGQIESIQRNTEQPAPETPVNRREPAPETKARSGATRIAVVSLEEMVGTYMSAKPLSEVVPMLEEENVDVVVLKINSGGGALLEIQRLQDVIVKELKPKFQVVSWIESAISAAAMTSHVVEDIYFMPEGNYGACTGWFGQLTAVTGRDLEEVLYMMEKASHEGGKDPLIMRAMQIPEPLSATIDQYGEVSWFKSEQGDYIVNPEGSILTFNSQNAKKFGFSKGTARTVDELARAMGYTEYEIVGEPVPGSLYPISKAEKHMLGWREGIKRAELRLTEFRVKYDISVANADSAPDKRLRGIFLGRATTELAQIERIIKEHPNLALFQLNALPEQVDEWLRQQRELLDRIRRKD